MNILIVAQHFPVCSARYAADAFTRLGHSVRHVGQPMGRNIWGMQVPEAYVWEPDGSLDDTQFMFSLYPDLIIVMDSDPAILDNIHLKFQWEERLSHVRHRAFIVWGVDNHVRDYRRPWFDHYFLAHRSVSVMDWYENYFVPKQGMGTIMFTNPIPDLTWLPCAYDPIAFPPSPIPWAERAWDVCMIGVMYPKRWELVNAMRAAGLKVLAGTGLVYDAYRDAYQNSRVALVSSFNGDLPIRLFEGAAMGCAVLCDEIADLHLEPFTDVDVDVAHFYHSVDEAVALAKYLQPHGSGDFFAEDSQAFIAPHTWDARAQVIVNWMEARS